MEPDATDVAVVESQLGRPPRGKWRVARRCKCGLPQVIETHPRLDDGSPFPTLWWLTCKSLSSAIGRLESSGWMAAMNERLNAEPATRSELKASTRLYLAARNALGKIGSSGHPGGGPDRVKCLHAHTAHHLVTDDNPVGKAVLDELSWTEPTQPCV